METDLLNDWMELLAKEEVLLKSSYLKMGGEMEKEYYEVLQEKKGKSLNKLEQQNQRKKNLFEIAESNLCYNELYVVHDMAGEKCGGLSSSSGGCDGLRPAMKA